VDECIAPAQGTLRKLAPQRAAVSAAALGRRTPRAPYDHDITCVRLFVREERTHLGNLIARG
jgi:hypothetical protein